MFMTRVNFDPPVMKPRNLTDTDFTVLTKAPDKSCSPMIIPTQILLAHGRHKLCPSVSGYYCTYYTRASPCDANCNKCVILTAELKFFVKQLLNFGFSTFVKEIISTRQSSCTVVAANASFISNIHVVVLCLRSTESHPRSPKMSAIRRTTPSLHHLCGSRPTATTSTQTATTRCHSIYSASCRRGKLSTMPAMLCCLSN